MLTSGLVSVTFRQLAPRDAEVQKLTKQAKDPQAQLEKEGVTLSERDRRNKEGELARLNRDLQRPVSS